MRLDPGEGSAGPPLWVRFDQPQGWIETDRPHAVSSLLAEVEQAAREGLFAVGCVSYECAPAFDDAHSVCAQTPSSAPLLAFGLFQRATVSSDPIPPFSTADRAPVRTEEQIEAAAYLEAIRTIREHIADGDVYQVNYTFPLLVSTPPPTSPATPADSPSDTLGDQLFRQLCRSQGGRYAVRLVGPALDVVSGSPELFFERNGHSITCRPMKGTAPRGRFAQEDEQLASALRASAKERAENLMIVDMMRNDLGRIARTGSVTVERLFEVERLPTLHQMTSSVTAHTDAPLAETFRALFPCASITGAPKSSAMHIISSLERAPRGIYTGAVGVVLPDAPEALGWSRAAAGTAFETSARASAKPAPYARFGVAIRTAWRSGSRESAAYRYGIGSGVVWDSEADAELTETRSKAFGLGLKRPPFRLLETMALHGSAKSGSTEAGRRHVRLWRQHRQRLFQSARYFAFPLDPDELDAAVDAACRQAPPGLHRLRLLVGATGAIHVERSARPRINRRSAWRLAVCAEPVDSQDPFLFHKTTHREVYDQRLDAVRARIPDADDALLQNEEGALTETVIANLLLPPSQPGGPWRTPHRTAGLLAGTLRAELLRRGRIIEADLRIEDLSKADRILLINSVRGVFPATLIEHP